MTGNQLVDEIINRMDPEAPNPAIFVLDLQDANKKQFF
jgi:hypothetical protein